MFNSNHKQPWLILLVVGAFLAAIVASCKKNPGPANPVITLTSPADTLVINVGDTISINGTVTDNESLHEVFISFKDNSSDSVLINDNPYTHGSKSYTFRYTWYATDASNYTLNIIAQDHDLNTTEKGFSFTVN